MKNILLIFGILFLTTLTVIGQDSFKKRSLEKTWKTEISLENESTELYDSLYEDFMNYFKDLTIKEEQEDLDNNSIYDNIYNSFNIFKEVNDENEEDLVNENIYLELLINLVKII